MLIQLLIIFISTISSTNSISGGKDVSINQFPFQVSVRLNGEHVCGGSIIDASTIVTAAHCVHGEDYFQFSVTVGDTFHSAGEKYLVMDIIEHPLYNRLTEHDCDIAILKLYTNLKFSKDIQPIALQEQDKEIPPGVTSWVSGWGNAHIGGLTVSRRLKAVENIIISNDDCLTMFKFHEDRISNRMMCAHALQCYPSVYNNAHSCTGDSGGPLVFNKTLVGIVSWGFDCTHPEYPGVYTKISAMHRWIKKNINKKPHFCSKL